MTIGDYQEPILLYNTFMSTNISPDASIHLAEIFRLLGQPVRIQILLIIASEEACVCHLEAVLGIRQAAISQQLMVLREAGLVVSNRDGRNIFYHLANPELFSAIYQVAAIAGVSANELAPFGQKPVPNCPCPRCNPDMDSEMSCQEINVNSSKTL
jgi:DNA-binding transcriptional ArsR family regulator